METTILYTAAVGLAAASAVFCALYLNMREKVKVLQSKIKGYRDNIEYYRKETNRLRDSLASAIGQLQAARAEMVSILDGLAAVGGRCAEAVPQVRQLKRAAAKGKEVPVTPPRELKRNVYALQRADYLLD